MNSDVFFGYGSLVNLDTHRYLSPRPARLPGFRRAWVASRLRPVAYLSAEPAGPDDSLWGVVAEVPGRDWAALDARERAYRRQPATVLPMPGAAPASGPAGTAADSHGKAAVYVLAREHRLADRRHPVLLSYLDTVVQGYLRLFGPEGVAHLAATTDNWDTPFLDDRAAPRYPRAQPLTADELAVTDALLREVGATRITAPD